MNLQEQMRLHKELSKKIEALEEQKKACGLAIMQQMQDKTLQVPGFIVKKFNRLSFKVSIQEAHAFGAVRLEETIDKEKLKALYLRGQKIQGISESQYIQVCELASH